MTSIPVDGKIIGIETKVELDFETYVGNKNPNPRVEIEPSGAEVTVVGLSNDPTPGSNAGFYLSDDFEIGDIVEAYQADGSTGEAIIYDSSNHSLAAIGDTGRAVRFRKIFSSSGRDWIVFT